MLQARKLPRLFLQQTQLPFASEEKGLWFSLAHQLDQLDIA